MVLQQVHGFVGLQRLFDEQRASLEFCLLLGQVGLEGIGLEHLRLYLEQTLLFFCLIDVKLLQFVLLDDCTPRLQDPAESFGKGRLIPNLFIPLLRAVKGN